MSERLSGIESRIRTVRQLAAVLTAMRGIAAARLREAETHLGSIRAYAGTVGNGIAGVLPLLPERRRTIARDHPAGSHVVLALCAEQGFVGLFNEHVLAVAKRILAEATDTTLLVIGDRGAALAAEQQITVAWSAPMITHTAQAVTLSNRIMDEIYARLHAGTARAVTIVYTLPDDDPRREIARRRLVPFDYRRFPAGNTAAPPMLNLPAPALLEKLAGEYMFAEVCEAVMLSFAAENAARVRSMISARNNVNTILGDLVSLSRQLRQEEITSEVLELAGFERRRQRSGHD